MKTVDFSETIAVSVLKYCRGKHLIECIGRFVNIKGHGHFLTLARGHVHTKIQTGFSEPNFV